MQYGPTRLAGSGCPRTNTGKHVLEERISGYEGEHAVGSEFCRQCGLEWDQKAEDEKIHAVNRGAWRARCGVPAYVDPEKNETPPRIRDSANKDAPAHPEVTCPACLDDSKRLDLHPGGLTIEPKTEGETPNDRRWRIRDIAREFRLAHSPACREANKVGAPKGEGRFPFKCECSFFEDVKKAEAGLLLVCHKAGCKERRERTAAAVLPTPWTPSDKIPGAYYCTPEHRDDIEWPSSLGVIAKPVVGKPRLVDICECCGGAYHHEPSRADWRGGKFFCKGCLGTGCDKVRESCHSLAKVTMQDTTERGVEPPVEAMVPVVGGTPSEKIEAIMADFFKEEPPPPIVPGPEAVARMLEAQVKAHEERKKEGAEPETVKWFPGAFQLEPSETRPPLKNAGEAGVELRERIHAARQGGAGAPEIEEIVRDVSDRLAATGSQEKVAPGASPITVEGLDAEIAGKKAAEQAKKGAGALRAEVMAAIRDEDYERALVALEKLRALKAAKPKPRDPCVKCGDECYMTGSVVCPRCFPEPMSVPRGTIPTLCDKCFPLEHKCVP